MFEDENITHKNESSFEENSSSELSDVNLNLDSQLEGESLDLDSLEIDDSINFSEQSPEDVDIDLDHEDIIVDEKADSIYSEEVDVLSDIENQEKLKDGYSIQSENPPSERDVEQAERRKSIALQTIDDVDLDQSRNQFAEIITILKDKEDLGVDSITRTRILELEDSHVLPPLILKQLQTEHLLSSRQIGRATARSMERLEIINFQDVPNSALDLKKDLDPRVQTTMRELRVIPIRKKIVEDGSYQLHIAYDSAMRNVILESRLKELLPNHRLIWHYATREVSGQFWVSGEEGDVKGSVDATLEAEDLLDRIISDAIDAGSSDIHIDPSITGEPIAMIKYRVDGYVKSKETINLDQLERLRVRIENIARMPSVNLSHPNKGAFTRDGYDWRVQVQPHAGRRGPLPRIVIRRLQPNTLPMEDLGYPEYFVKKIKAAALAPNGVIFWTGPTGSGKTESIHSAVVSADPMGRGLSVHTIEDPPEKRVSGYAVQMEISELDPARTGLELLKSSLRADPDVIIVGEVRDPTMAQLVFDAANTGHLVFSTLHTNNSIDGMVRLEELDIKGFVMSYIRGMVAQRLARRLCNHCKVFVGKPREQEIKVFDLYQKFGLDYKHAEIYEAKPDGCPNCNNSGYAGRIALAEILVPDMEIIQAIADGKFSDLEEIATRKGWKPMGYMGCEHAINGITDVAELQRVVLELSGLDLEEDDNE